MTPDKVEHDKKKITKPAFDLILGVITQSKLELFWISKERTLPLITPFSNEKALTRCQIYLRLGGMDCKQ